MNIRPLFAHAHGFRSTYTAPTAGYALQTNNTNGLQTINVPGLSNASAVTVFLILNKISSAESLFMACAIKEYSTQNLIDICYAGRSYNQPLGFGLNTYSSGFTTFDNKAILDNNKTILVTATLYNNDYSKFNQTVNGNASPFVQHLSQVNRYFSDSFIVGGGLDPSHVWQGDIKDCYLYLSDLSATDKTQTEGYLLAKYNIAQ